MRLDLQLRKPPRVQEIPSDSQQVVGSRHMSPSLRSDPEQWDSSWRPPAHSHTQHRSTLCQDSAKQKKKQQLRTGTGLNVGSASNIDCHGGFERITLMPVCYWGGFKCFQNRLSPEPDNRPGRMREGWKMS
ncbi:hypothetical protein MHYP_G00199820 [Metynnis hypsauchen]